MVVPKVVENVKFCGNPNKNPEKAILAKSGSATSHHFEPQSQTQMTNAHEMRGLKKRVLYETITSQAALLRQNDQRDSAVGFSA